MKKTKDKNININDIPDIPEDIKNIDLTHIEDRDELLKLLNEYPILIGWKAGRYSKLNKLHNFFLKRMIQTNGMYTIIAHRGSYKSTCACIYAALAVLFDSRKRIAYSQCDERILLDRIIEIFCMMDTFVYKHCCSILYNVSINDIKINKLKASIKTSLPSPIGDYPNITAVLIGGKIQGLHFDKIITDDVVVEKDRREYAKRIKTKTACKELWGPILTKDEGYQMINVCTPWHPEDAVEEIFKRKTPNRNYIEVNCENSGFFTLEDIKQMRIDTNDDELFNANYYLIHTSSDNLPFTDIKRINVELNEYIGSIMHIDASFYGKDKTAITILKEITTKEDKVIYVVLGKIVDNVHIPGMHELLHKLFIDYKVSTLYMESNADKGEWIKKEAEILDELFGLKINYETYHENMKKQSKISLLKQYFQNLFFDVNTDEEYIKQIENYTLVYRVAHDDAPDSLISALLKLNKGAKLYFSKNSII